MHSEIIQFISPNNEKDVSPIIDENFYDDPVVQMNSDWFGNEIDTERRKFVISWLEKKLKGIANVDCIAETITLLPKDVRKKTFNSWIKENLNEVVDDASLYKIRQKIFKYKDMDELFVVNNYCAQQSGEFIEDLVNGYHGETFKIGNMLDYHS